MDGWMHRQLARAKAAEQLPGMVPIRVAARSTNAAMLENSAVLATQGPPQRRQGRSGRLDGVWAYHLLKRMTEVEMDIHSTTYE